MREATYLSPVACLIIQHSNSLSRQLPASLRPNMHMAAQSSKPGCCSQPCRKQTLIHVSHWHGGGTIIPPRLLPMELSPRAYCVLNRSFLDVCARCSASPYQYTYGQCWPGCCQLRHGSYFGVIQRCDEHETSTTWDHDGSAEMYAATGWTCSNRKTVGRVFEIADGEVRMTVKSVPTQAGARMVASGRTSGRFQSSTSAEAAPQPTTLLQQFLRLQLPHTKRLQRRRGSSP